MANLQSLGPAESFDITFERLFQARLTTGQLARAQCVYGQLRRFHSFSVANVIHLSSQKGNVEEVLAVLEQWCDIVRYAPDLITAYVKTKQLSLPHYQ